MLQGKSRVSGRASGKESVAFKGCSDREECDHRDGTGGSEHAEANGRPEQERNRRIEAGVGETGSAQLSFENGNRRAHGQSSR